LNLCFISVEDREAFGDGGAVVSRIRKEIRTL